MNEFPDILYRMLQANGHNVIPNRSPVEYLARLNKPDQQMYVATKGEVGLIPKYHLEDRAEESPSVPNNRVGLILSRDSIECFRLGHIGAQDVQKP